MKTNKMRMRNAGRLCLVLLVLIISTIAITNCSKKGSETSKKSMHLKSDSIHVNSEFTLIPQDSLSLIKKEWGAYILLFLQQNYNNNLTDFNILSDTIPFANDTCTFYMMKISYQGCSSKNLATRINVGFLGKKSTANYVVQHIWTCKGTCSNCSMFQTNGYSYCKCYGNDGTCLLTEYNIYWWSNK